MGHQGLNLSKDPQLICDATACSCNVNTLLTIRIRSHIPGVVVGSTVAVVASTAVVVCSVVAEVCVVAAFTVVVTTVYTVQCRVSKRS